MSRFSALIIEDDDDEQKVAKNRNKQKDLGPYVVSTNNQAAKKKKKQQQKVKQKQQVDSIDDNVWQDTFDNEENESLRKAIILSTQEYSKEEQNRKRLAEEEEKQMKDVLKNSQAAETTVHSARGESTVASFSKQKAVNSEDVNHGLSSGIDTILAKLDSEAKKLRDQRPNLKDSNERNPIVALYRNKCKEFAALLIDKDDTIESLEDRLKKAKERNKKFGQILSDAEIREKAEILVDMDKIKTVNAELTEEISVATGELEQVKSRNHELELEMKKLGAAKGLKQ